MHRADPAQPLELLFAQYKVDRDGIERIAGFVDDAKQMHYFLMVRMLKTEHQGYRLLKCSSVNPPCAH